MCSINISKTRLIKITSLLHSLSRTSLNCRFIVQTCLSAQATTYQLYVITDCYSLCGWDKWILKHFALGFTAKDNKAEMHSSNHAPCFLSRLLISSKVQVAHLRPCWFHFIFSQFFFSPEGPLSLCVSVQFPLDVCVVALFPQLPLQQRQRSYSPIFFLLFLMLKARPSQRNWGWELNIVT